ncbi:MAG: Ldh family oxidoreductase [Candidatus Woesearchaeota archaeon]
MKITIEKARTLSIKILRDLGLSEEESLFVTENLIQAELCGKKTHGLVRLNWFMKRCKNYKKSTDKLNIINQTNTSLHIDGKEHFAMPIIYKSLEKAFQIVKQSKVVCVGIKDTDVSGFLGDYARIVTEKNLIFIGFFNSQAQVIPHGSKQKLWGTDPLTVGIPTNNLPVILDMASSKITWGGLLVAQAEGKKIEKGLGLDKEGNPTTNPHDIIDEGGLFPFFGHKGSGLAFIVELLAGALTGSMIGHHHQGGCGSFYILIDPTLFRPLNDFKKDVEKAINSLKNSPRIDENKEIFFAGERSQALRKKHLKEGSFEINESLQKLFEM